MVIRRHGDSDERWMVAAYDDSGAHLGYSTGRDTIMSWSTNGATYVNRAAADIERTHMERIWPNRIWLVERQPTYPIDARTGARLPEDVVKRRHVGGWMQGAVDEGVALEVERDGRIRRERNKTSSTLDTDARHGVASNLRGQRRGDVDTRMASDDTYDDEEGVSMVLVKDGKKAAAKSATKKTSSKGKAAAKEVAATKARPQPKSVLRTAASASSKRAAAETNGGGPCLCGCPSTAVKWFRRGHIKRFDSQLAAIKAGTIKPTTAFGKDIAKAMGPWKENRGGGFVPATTNFDKIRASL